MKLLAWGNNVPTGALDLFDGRANTLTITQTPGIGTNTAAFCYNNTADGFPVGTRYLAAICQLGGEGLGAGCPPSNANLNNLKQLGFLDPIKAAVDLFWSSTECAQFPDQCA